MTKEIIFNLNVFPMREGNQERNKAKDSFSYTIPMLPLTEKLRWKKKAENLSPIFFFILFLSDLTKTQFRME